MTIYPEQQALKTQMVGTEWPMRRAGADATYYFLCTFASTFIPEEERQDFWKSIKKATHERAELKFMHVTILKGMLTHLPTEKLSGRIGTVMTLLNSALSDHKGLSDKDMDRSRIVHEAICADINTAQVQLNHLNQGGAIQNAVKALAPVFEASGAQLFVEQPPVRDICERKKDEEALFTQLIHLKMQRHWSCFLANSLLFVRWEVMFRTQPRDLAKGVTCSLKALLVMNQGLYGPSVQEFSAQAKGVIFSSLAGAAVRAVEPV